jgi:hypothetical protein
MQFRRLPLGVAVLALLAAIPAARATTVIQPTFEEMVGSADYVVRVVVKSVESSWREDSTRAGQRYIGSNITLDVREVITGTPPSPLVLDVVGGKVGKDELSVSGTPKLEVGQECVLFVRGNGRTFFPVVGLNHGYFPVRRDARTGDAQVLRADGRLLYNTQELDPVTSNTRLAHGSLDRPLTPQGFSAQIQQQQRANLSREKQK